MNTQLFTLLLSVISTISLSAQTSQLKATVNTPECRTWVDSVYNTLNTDEKIAQLMVQNVSPRQADKSQASIKSCVDQYKIGGLFFSEGSSDDFADMTNYAQSIAEVPLLIAIDGEWGPSMRVQDAPLFPRNMTLGAIQDPTLLFRYGAETARECQALGIHMNFAPVLDVNSNPDNPVIGDRSYGEDPHRVAALGRAYSLGMESGGVMAVGKHFPGHGDTNSDSHKTLPTVTHPMEVLETVDLFPFKTFIDAGCGGIMVGHLDVPALDKNHRPASMSNQVSTQLLKDKMGFEGLVITDGLGMKGANVNGNVCVEALKAGADILLGPRNIPQDIAAIKQAINKGEIPMSVIEEKCKKMLAYKYALNVQNAEPVDKESLKAQLFTHETDALLQELADASITVVRDQNGQLPLGNLAKAQIAIVNIGDTGKEFTEYCKKYAKADVYDVTENSPLTAKALDAIKSHDVIIAAVYDDNANAQNTLAQLKGIKGLIPVFFKHPYKLRKFRGSIANSPILVMAYEDSPYQRKAAAKALFGGIDVTGRMPVNVNGIANLGDGITIEKSRLGYSSPAAKGMNPNLTERMDSAVNAALASGAFPGAQLIVVKGGDVIVDRSYGLTTQGGEKVTDATIYDLASVSKTVGTLSGVMKAYDLGLFELDTPASEYIPGLNVEGKDLVTPRMLLHHETGIPAALNMFNVMMDTATYNGTVITGKKDKDHTIAITGGGYGHNKAKMRKDIISDVKDERFNVEIAKGIYGGQMTYDTIMATIYRTNVDPSRKFRYSCLNFCLLMDLTQRVSGQRGDHWVEDSIWAPIGAYGFCYRPIERYDLKQIAATENDTYLRKQHVHGYVHDELSAFSGGIQGNAGVFGTATDIAKLCQMWVNGGTYGDVRVLSDATAKLFTSEKSPTCRRGLGFDKPDMENKDNSPTCDEASAATYGHTGFTGTCFWVDPESDIIFVFLSNRVDPTRANKAFSESAIRPTLMTMVYEAMRD